MWSSSSTSLVMFGLLLSLGTPLFFLGKTATPAATALRLNFIDYPSATKSPFETMQAVTYAQRGTAPHDVLALRTNVPRPVMRNDQILVRVPASALNPVDFKMRRIPVPSIVRPLPKIPGMDLAGTIVDMGSQVLPQGHYHFQVGDTVAAMTPLIGSMWGAAAEYVAIKADYVAKIPTGMNLTTAAAVPLAALTAVQKLQRLETGLSSTQNKRILIHAGAGGVGSFAIQYAKHVLGMYVATTASAGKADLLRNLGADEVINYQTTDFTTVIQDYDAVLDTMSFLYEHKTLKSKVLKPSGIYLNVLSSDWTLVNGREKSLGPISMIRWIRHSLQNWIRPGSIPRYDLSFVQPDGALLQEILNLVQNGTIKVVVDSVYSWTNVVQAYDKLETGHATGKIVLLHN